MDFKHGVVVGARWGGLKVSETSKSTSGIFTQNHLLSNQRIVRKKENE